MTDRVKVLIQNLERNNFNAFYFEDSKSAVEYLKTNLKKGATVTSGGSMTLGQSGIAALISGGEYNFLNRANMGNSEEEFFEFYKNTLGCDYYFCSANAVTEKGEIVNVDGLGNRISASAFGPKQVFIIMGTNKIVKDTTAAFLRVKTVAAPKNAVRLSCDTPCAKIGKCVSLLKSDNPGITDGCDSPHRICRDYLVMGKQNNTKRITVIIIDEELGY